MARTPKLTDLQLILLTTAGQRPDGSLLPPPDSVSEQRDRITKAIAALIKRGLAVEAEVAQPAVNWRQDADRLIGVCISDAGRSAIGVDGPSAGAAGNENKPAPGEPQNRAAIQVDSQAPPASTPREGSKQALVITMMTRPEGATLPELVEATSWLPHTTRAALTGLRKKGHAIRKAQRDEVTCYYLGGAA